MSKNGWRPSKEAREKNLKEERRENRLSIGMIVGIPLALLIFNPMLGRAVVWMFQINDDAPPQRFTVAFWISTVVTALPILLGVGSVYIRKPGNESITLPVIGFTWTLTWLIRLFGSQYTDYSTGDISRVFGLSYTQADFLQRIATPVCVLFAVMVVAQFFRIFVPDRYFTRKRAVLVFSAFAALGIGVFIYGGLQHDYRDLWVGVN